jgi:hypothetical protein
MGLSRTFADGYQAENDLRQHDERVLAEQTRTARIATVCSDRVVEGAAVMKRQPHLIAPLAVNEKAQQRRPR